MKIDEDGMVRVDLEWTIESTARAPKTGRLYELHEQEVAAARQMIKRHAKRGDTIIIKTT